MCQCGWVGIDAKSTRIQTGLTSSGIRYFCPSCEKRIVDWDYEIDRFTPIPDYFKKSDPDEIFDQYETARLLNVPVDVINKLTGKKKLPSIKKVQTTAYSSPRTMVKKSDLDKLIRYEQHDLIPLSKSRKCEWFSVMKDYTIERHKKPIKNIDVLYWIHKKKVFQNTQSRHQYKYRLYLPNLKPTNPKMGKFSCVAVYDHQETNRTNPVYSILFLVKDNRNEIREFYAKGNEEHGVIESLIFLQKLLKYADWTDYNLTQELQKTLGLTIGEIKDRLSTVLNGTGIRFL
jgi:hypothetical protein